MNSFYSFGDLGEALENVMSLFLHVKDALVNLFNVYWLLFESIDCLFITVVNIFGPHLGISFYCFIVLYIFCRDTPC